MPWVTERGGGRGRIEGGEEGGEDGRIEGERERGRVEGGGGREKENEPISVIC